jgi:predicted RNA methylase
MNFTFKDTVWLVGVFVALGATWGMTSQRVTAMERDLDRMETAIQIFTKIETRIAVIETEVKNINQNLERMTNGK